MMTDQSLEDPIQSNNSDDLLGCVFAVPDKWWGFEAEGRDHHPGACVQERPAKRDFVFLKGTGAENKSTYRKNEMIVTATEDNGLAKLTLFSLKPWPFREHKVRNLVPERVMGRLSEIDLKRLQTEMIRQFGNQG